jgi:hypothetical protein
MVLQAGCDDGARSSVNRNLEYLYKRCRGRSISIRYSRRSSSSSSSPSAFVLTSSRSHDRVSLFFCINDVFVASFLTFWFLRMLCSGINNTIVESEVRALEAPTGSDENWAGNGFYAVKKELKTTSEGARQADPSRGRQWTMTNPNKKHYSSGANVGYKVSTVLSRSCQRESR